MKSKKILVAVISAVLLLAVSLLGLNTVLSVSSVLVDYTVYSEQAQADVEKISETLEKNYKGKNLLFLKTKDILSDFEAYPYLNVLSVGKNYPNGISLKVEEKTEAYAVSATEEGQTVYYVMDSEGFLLGRKTQNVNNVDGKENFLIEGIAVRAGGTPEWDGNWSTALAVCNRVEKGLGTSLRSCMTKMEVYAPTSNTADTQFIFYTREGVKIHVVDPFRSLQEKTDLAVREYLALDDGKKIYGDLFIQDDERSGDIICTYTGYAA